LEIQQAAGSLPASVGGPLRLRVAAEWILRRLSVQPGAMLGAYALALAGAASGIGFQIYITYRLPDFLDLTRLTSSIEQGLIIGSIFGLGLFLSRLIVERFQESPALARLLAGALAGTLVINTALLFFHMLFLNTPPSGILITLGCTLIAAGHAVGGLIRPRAVRMLISTAGAFLAIAGTWWVHAAFAATPLALTPMFRYEYTWPLTQAGLAALAVSLPMGIFTNLVRLEAIEDPL
jgi:hypothetical protein